MHPIAIVITAVAVGCFGTFVLLGARMDGRRQKVLEQGKHPVTTSTGEVRAEEDIRDL